MLNKVDIGYRGAVIENLVNTL